MAESELATMRRFCNNSFTVDVQGLYNCSKFHAFMKKHITSNYWTTNRASSDCQFEKTEFKNPSPELDFKNTVQ